MTRPRTAPLLLLAALLCVLPGTAPGQPGQPDVAQQELRAASALEEAATALEAAAKAYTAGEDATVRARTQEADDAFGRVQDALGVSEDLRQRIPVLDPMGSAATTPGSFRKAAEAFREAAGLLGQAAERRTAAARLRAARDEDAAGERAAEAADARADAEEKAFQEGWRNAEKAAQQDAVVTGDMQVLAVLLLVLAGLFAFGRYPFGRRIYKVLPLLVFCYFVPTVLSNLGLIPIDAPVYGFIMGQLLPASLVLLVLSVDIPAIMRLGRNALVLFLTGTVTIVVGGPLALLLFKGLLPEAMGDQAWKGLSALAGSWIGGGANFIAIGKSVGASANTISMMVIVDVAVAEVWMIVLLFFAGREKAMDAKIGADRTSLDAVRAKIESFEREVARPTNLPDLLAIGAIAFVTTAAAGALADVLPEVGDIISRFTWIVILCTTVAVALSFTRLRHLEGAGASKLGSVLLYLLVASIGAHAEFRKVLQVPSLILIGAVWMLFHAVVLLLVRRWLKAPIFFAAVGSKANVGGAASAPIVASAFHPALAPVGVLLAVGGYVLGTYAALLCASLLRLVA